jgi:hypothetical protein
MGESLVIATATPSPDHGEENNAFGASEEFAPAKQRFGKGS